jgi:hypothetical protein
LGGYYVVGLVAAEEETGGGEDEGNGVGSFCVCC